MGLISRVSSRTYRYKTMASLADELLMDFESDEGESGSEDEHLAPFHNESHDVQDDEDEEAAYQRMLEQGPKAQALRFKRGIDADEGKTEVRVHKKYVEPAPMMRASQDDMDEEDDEDDDEGNALMKKVLQKAQNKEEASGKSQARAKIISDQYGDDASGDSDDEDGKLFDNQREREAEYKKMAKRITSNLESFQGAVDKELVEATLKKRAES